MWYQGNQAFPAASSMTTNATPSGSTSGFSQATPYIQGAMDIAKVYGGRDPISKLNKTVEGVASKVGTNFKRPKTPQTMSKKWQAARKVGETALNFVPVAGPVFSQAAKLYHGNVEQKAMDDYMKQLMKANPDIIDPQELGIKPEFVPQTNWVARTAQGYGKGVNKLIEEKLYPMGRKVTEGISSLPGGDIVAAPIKAMNFLPEKLVGISIESKRKQRKKQREIHEKNIEKGMIASTRGKWKQQNKKMQESMQPNPEMLMQFLAPILAMKQQGNPYVSNNVTL